MRNALWISAAVKCWSECIFIIFRLYKWHELVLIMQFAPRVIYGDALAHRRIQTHA